MKWKYLVSLSTTTKMILCLPDLGRPSIKSMETWVQVWLGIGNGTSSLG
jgi:hypothetical protein